MVNGGWGLGGWTSITVNSNSLMRTSSTNLRFIPVFISKLYPRNIACLDSLLLKTDTVLVSVSAMGSEFQRVGPGYVKLDLNKSNLGVGTLSFLD